MSFFGTVLLKENLVTEQQLVEALVRQAEELASPIRICLDQHLVPVPELVNAVLQAAEQHQTLLQTLQERHPLPGDPILQTLKKKRRPIGQLLVEQGVELKRLSSLLSDFQKTQDQLPPADGFEFHFPEVHGETKKQYLNFFSAALKENMEKLIHGLHEDSTNASLLEDLLHQLSAAAGFTRMEVSRHLTERAALLLERFNTRQLLWESALAAGVQRDLLSTLDVLWELQRFIEISGSEREFWQNRQSRQNYLNAFQALERHLSR